MFSLHSVGDPPPNFLPLADLLVSVDLLFLVAVSSAARNFLLLPSDTDNDRPSEARPAWCDCATHGTLHNIVPAFHLIPVPATQKLLLPHYAHDERASEARGAAGGGGQEALLSLDGAHLLLFPFPDQPPLTKAAPHLDQSWLALLTASVSHAVWRCLNALF